MSDDRTAAEKLEGLTRAFKAATPGSVQKVGGLLAQAAGQFAEDAGQADVEMTLCQWVEQLPPMHVARKELRELNERLNRWAGQITRLPDSGGITTAEHRVDAVLKRLVEAEGALASLVHLAERIQGGVALPEGLDAALETATKILDARPSALGGTATSASKGRAR